MAFPPLEEATVLGGTAGLVSGPHLLRASWARSGLQETLPPMRPRAGCLFQGAVRGVASRRPFWLCEGGECLGVSFVSHGSPALQSRAMPLAHTRE